MIKPRECPQRKSVWINADHFCTKASVALQNYLYLCDHFFAIDWIYLNFVFEAWCNGGNALSVTIHNNVDHIRTYATDWKRIFTWAPILHNLQNFDDKYHKIHKYECRLMTMVRPCTHMFLMHGLYKWLHVNSQNGPIKN